MEDLAAFPRGGRQRRTEEVEETADDKKKKRVRDKKKKESGTESIKTDFLFGSTEDDKKKRKKRKISDSSSKPTSTSQSLLPMGGGGVIVAKSQKHKKDATSGKSSSTTTILIESFGFSKLAKGTKVLGVVREVQREYAVVSLPNLLSGYILPKDDETSLKQCLSIGQTLAVVVQKVVTESIKNGGQRRRIQVSPLPSAVNPRMDGNNKSQQQHSPNLPIRGQIVSNEDHGCLVDLGYGRKGFLKFDDIDSHINYKILDEDADDEEEEEDAADENDQDDDGNNKKKSHKKETRILQPGRLYDFLVTQSTEQVFGLSLPSVYNLAKQSIAPPATKYSTPYTLNSISPGWLVQAKVEALAKNGICVTFLNNVFRGSIELSHLGANFVPTIKENSSAWRDVFEKHQHFQARVIAVDVPTKMIRLSLAPHVLDLTNDSTYNSTSAAADTTSLQIGSVIKDCTVIRQDPGIGALLALPESFHRDPETYSRRIQKSELFKSEAYAEASKTRAVYVHISKALEDHDASGSTFSKEFAPSTIHDVRILGTGNLVDGVATGACALSILKAHVLTHDDLKPGQLYKQVPVCAQLQGGSILVQLGGSFKNTTDVRGLIPAMHLFETSNSSEFRRKLLKAKFAVDAKIDVRVLQVQPEKKKCIVTAKKSMVKADDSEMITSYEDLQVGKHAVGFISRVDEKSIFVTFCNRVYGRVTAKSLLSDLGVEDHTESYQVGDVVKCRVVKVKKRKTGKFSREGEDDNMDVDSDGENEGGKRTFWDVALSLKVDDDANEGDGDEEMTDQIDFQQPKEVRIKAGAILPLKSMKIVQLQSGRTKTNGSFVPGYAVVSIKSKHVVDDSTQSGMTPTIECKLPYDQLLDEYHPDDIESVEAFDALAERLLTVGKKINQKGLLLTDPHRSDVDYSTGIGKFPVVSIRKRLIQTAEKQYTSEELSPNDAIIPDPSSELFVGALLHGYVAQVDERHGAFIRFLGGMTGLVPKKFGGTDIPQHDTVVTRVKAIDDTQRPFRILLDVVGSSGKKALAAPYKAGDKIELARVKKVQFHETELVIPDSAEATDKMRFILHCTLTKCRETKVKVSKKESKKLRKHEISKGHPFHGMKAGQELSELTVAAVRHNRGRFTVYVTNKSINDDSDEKMEEATSAPTLIENRSDLASGMITTAFISAIGEQNKGIFVSVSPFVQGFIPGLEVSRDLQILNNLDKHIKTGTTIKCRVMDQGHWHEVRGQCPFASEHYVSLATRKSEEAENPKLFLSVIACEEESIHVTKPKHGDVLVGRIQKNLPQILAPSLMVSLRGGYVGRCCITELAENDDWTNMPISAAPVLTIKPDREKPRPAVDSMDVDKDDSDDEAGSDAESESEEHPEMEGPFPDGKYIECRVLKSFGKQSLVDVSLRGSRVEGDLDDDPSPDAGETAQAYVIQTNRKGCFVRLARHIEGRVTLKELCDGFLPDPEKSFPMGRLVVGKVKTTQTVPKKSKNSKDPVRIRVDMDMRESTLLGDEKKLEFEKVELNQKYRGTVTRVESYGVFVQLENSKVSGLVHMSECSDKFIKNLQALYDPGDLVKVLVIKKDADSKKLGFSMKASHFENDEDSEDDSSVESEEANEDENMVKVASAESDSDEEKGSDEELDSDDENFASKLAAKMQEDGDDDDGSSSDSDGSSSDDDDDADKTEDSSDDDSDDDPKAKSSSAALDTDVGFEWGAGGSSSQDKGRDKDDDSDDDSSSDEDDEGDDEQKTSSHKSRKKQAQRRREEREISRREIALADGTADENPETAGDFERLLAGNPNDSELWIRYMAFHLSLSDIPAARAVAEKAMDRIEFRQEKEKLNVWTALLTLEHKYGDEKSLADAIKRACGQNNPKQVYLRACEILEKDSSSPDAVEAADSMFSKMCKKFKSKKTVWLAHLQYLLKQHRHQEAHALLKRALLSLASYKHAETMSKFAQLEFEYGSLERARTMFDGLVEKHPKRLDLFFVYVDKEIKFGSLETARTLLQKKVDERTLSDKKMKNLFKKWYRLEEEHGTEESQENVKAAARSYVESSTS